MSLFWVALLFTVTTLVPLPVSANHFPPELEYLNGTEIVAEMQCFDGLTTQVLLCRLHFDRSTGTFYRVQYTAGQRVLRVSRFYQQGHPLEVIYEAPR